MVLPHSALEQLLNMERSFQDSSGCPTIANCPWVAQRPGSAPGGRPLHSPPPQFWEKPVTKFPIVWVLFFVL